MGFDEDDQHRIGMAVRECMVNAVVHGNRYNRNKQVHVNVLIGKFETGLRFDDPDHGSGRRFRNAGSSRSSARYNLLRHSGRGLFLMGAFMDDLKVRKVSPAGTEVTLVKNIGPPE